MARRALKHHVQQNLFRRGGKRAGAGRKPKNGWSGAPHKRRPKLVVSQPVHVVLRVLPVVGNLRRRETYKAVLDACTLAATRARIRICHISIQRTHLHLIVEAPNKLALARGLQGFQVSVARRVNTLIGESPYRRRRGPVFTNRYHAVAITSPTQMRNVLSYVLSNWRKHAEDRTGTLRGYLIDPFSSGYSFSDWHELRGQPPQWPTSAPYGRLIVSPPRSWVLRTGWKLAGPISLHAVPSRPSRSS